MADLPPDFEERSRRLLKMIPPFIDDVETLVDKNRIWLDRSVGRGGDQRRGGRRLGLDRPLPARLRRRLRRAQGAPYDLYDTVDWEVPVFFGGDVYDRYRVRIAEIRSRCASSPAARPRHARGPDIVDDPHVALPPKEKVYNEMEAMIYHFKLIMDGIQVPAGRALLLVEGANGELGFYCITDGGASPTACACRPPCFPIFSILPDAWSTATRSPTWLSPWAAST